MIKVYFFYSPLFELKANILVYWSLRELRNDGNDAVIQNKKEKNYKNIYKYINIYPVPGLLHPPLVLVPKPAYST